jgi:hypothetical protein
MVKINKTLSNDEILRELLNKQIDDVDIDKKMQYSDLKRMCKYIDTSIFDEDQCCIWKGYVTNSNNSKKGTYINFYFKGKKAALHRLLYCNFVEELSNECYLKFNCENKGTCCNISHLKKFYYNKEKPIKKSKKSKGSKKSKDKTDKTIHNVTIETDPNKLIITFD